MSDATEVGSVFVSNYPPYSFWSPDQLPAVVDALESPPRPEVPMGLYLHIPFCRKRCRFCYFRVYIDRNAAEIGRYLDALAREVELLSQRPAVTGRPLRFVYFGGGTPSYLSVRQLTALVERARAAIPWSGQEEVTFECEPGTLSRSKLRALKELGVTRLSLGIENFDDRILELNGRAHLSAEIDRVRPWIVENDFAQVNVDLIAGMLGETWAAWRRTVERTIAYEPDSVTVYQMELPWNTVFSKQMLEDEGEIEVADWDTKRAWHDWAFEELEKAGYELSSAYTMVRKGSGAQFLYRDSVWNGHDMVGTGVASFSHLSGVHYQNHDQWEGYLDSLESGMLPLARAFSTEERERLTRELILQLKLGALPRRRLEKKFGVDVLEEYRGVFDRLEKERMLSTKEGEVRLTRAGLLQVDRLLPEFYDPQYQGTRYT